VEFEQKLYKEGFVYTFDWMSWKEGEQLLIEKERIGFLDLLTIQKLITAIVRAERFGDGSLASAINRGVIGAILRRLDQIGQQVIGSNSKAVRYCPNDGSAYSDGSITRCKWCDTPLS